MSDVLHIDASAGASGDMFLGAVVDLGADVADLQRGLSKLAPDVGRITVDNVRRGGLRALRCAVAAPKTTSPTRHLDDIRTLLSSSRLPAGVTDVAVAAFTRLAEAEAGVHGCRMEDVHFHEVGAWDSLSDVVGSLLGLYTLGLLGVPVTVTPISVGSGTVRTDHGVLPVPTPATLALLATAGAPVTSGPTAHEACTPTGAALLGTLATSWGGMPPMTVTKVGVGAGGRDTPEAPNVLRLVRGSATQLEQRLEDLDILETTVDDLDPRVWPDVLDALVQAGAHDAWLTPVVMRKGRPGHVVTALVPAIAVAGVQTALFRHTPTLGVRLIRAQRSVLPRRETVVNIGGVAVRVKLAGPVEAPLTVQPELTDARRAAEATGRSLRDVLIDAAARGRQMG